MNNKQFNNTVAYYSKEDKILNPKLIMRFDCHKINDIQCIKLYDNESSKDKQTVQ